MRSVDLNNEAIEKGQASLAYFSVPLHLADLPSMACYAMASSSSMCIRSFISRRKVP